MQEWTNAHKHARYWRKWTEVERERTPKTDRSGKDERWSERVRAWNWARTCSHASPSRQDAAPVACKNGTNMERDSKDIGRYCWKETRWEEQTAQKQTEMDKDEREKECAVQNWAQSYASPGRQDAASACSKSSCQQETDKSGENSSEKFTMKDRNE